MLKNKMIYCMLFALLSVGLAFSAASASIVLFELAFNANGTVTDYLPYAGVIAPAAGALDAEGLGTLTWTSNTPGKNTFIAFVDHEIDESVNGFSNEFGSVHGALAAGQSFEIDEPGYVFGDIFANVKNGTLDNTNGVPVKDDVSMALGWSFILNPGDSATITLKLSRDVPVAGFYLSQTDPDSPDTFYFFSTLELQLAPAPLPGTLFLLGSGLAGLWFCGRKRFL
jgi:hypothetical protein